MYSKTKKGKEKKDTTEKKGKNVNVNPRRVMYSYEVGTDIPLVLLASNFLSLIEFSLNTHRLVSVHLFWKSIKNPRSFVNHITLLPYRYEYF